MQMNIKEREKDWLMSVTLKNGTIEFEFDTWPELLVYLCSIKDPCLIKTTI